MSKFLFSTGIMSLLLLMLGSPDVNAFHLPEATNFKSEPAHVIKVHSAKRVHDDLHRLGFSRVILQRTRKDAYGKPVYRFSACQEHRRYRIVVNWYGEILRIKRKGFCRLPKFYY